MKYNMLKRMAIISMAFVSIAIHKVYATQAAADAVATLVHPEVMVDVLKIEGKKLQSKAMETLDSILAESPIGIMRMSLAYNAATKVLNELNSDPDCCAQPDLVAKMTSIISPVKEFFDIVHSFKGIVDPLIRQSLMNQGIVTTQPPIVAHEKDCLILKFFDSPDKATTFFESSIKTREDLRRACNEFVTFFKDIRTSLTQKSIEAYKKLAEEIKKSKK